MTNNMETSSKASQWAALAATAFISASVVAVSAFLLHKRAIDRLLDGPDTLPAANNVSDEKKNHRPTKNTGGRAPSPSQGWRVRSSSYSRDHSSASFAENLHHGNAYDGSKSRGFSKSESDIKSIQSGLPRVHTHKEGLVK